MTTPPNPQQLLRRPKKPAEKAGSPGLIAAAAAAVLVAGAVAGFVALGHGKGAASDTAGATTHVAAVPVAQTYAPVSDSTTAVKHAPHKPGTAAKLSAGASPTAQPTSTPDATPTPVLSRPTTPAETAKAKHQAALHHVALHRQQVAALANASDGSSLAPGGTATGQVTSNAPPPSQTVPTQAPAAPNAEPTPVYAPRVVVDARFVDRVAPVYPDIAREQGAQGTAIVLATVGPKGDVMSVQIDQSTGNKLLDQAALSAARSSRFQPPEVDGKPATETYRIVYTFDPNG